MKIWFILLLILLVSCNGKTNTQTFTEQPESIESIQLDTTNVSINIIENKPTQETRTFGSSNKNEMKLDLEFADGHKFQKTFKNEVINSYLIENNVKLYIQDYVELRGEKTYLTFILIFNKDNLKTEQATLMLGPQEGILTVNYDYADVYFKKLLYSRFNIEGGYSQGEFNGLLLTRVNKEPVKIKGAFSLKEFLE